MDRAATESVPEPAADEARVLETRAPLVAPPELFEALLRPRSVALIGAGNDPEQASGRPLQLLRYQGYGGRVYPVAAGRRLVQGGRAWPDVAALPETVDLALVLLAGDAAIDAVEACGRARIPVAVLASPLGDRLGVDLGAMSETARVGTARLLEIAERHGVRVLGPGSAGVVVPAQGLALTGEPTFAARRMRAGRLALLSHSGSVMGALFSRAAARDIGYAALVGLGAELDLSLGEIGSALADESDCDAFLLFLHRLKHTADLARFAAKAHGTGKPVIAYKLAQDPTRAPAAGDRPGAADAFCRAHGIVLVEQFDALLELAPMLVRRRPSRGRTIALVSTAECAGALVADRLASVAVTVDGLDDLARQRLAQAGVVLPGGRIANVSGARPEAVRAVLGEALEAPNNDAVLAVLGAGAELEPDAAVMPVIDAAARADKPLAALVVPESPEALRLLGAAGIAAFRTPEAAADGLRAFLNWTPPSAPAILWEDDAPRPNRRLHAGQAMRIFRLLGVPMPTMLWIKRDAPVPGALPFPPPYVLKVLSPDIEHRIEIGGVALGLETISAVQAAAADMLRRVGEARPDAFLDGILIQRVERGLAEVAIGFRRDPEAGPVATLAMGEGMGETYGDRAVRLAPIDRAIAYDMIDEVRGLARIRGFRYRTRGDLEALADALVAISSLALVTTPRVLAAAVDPLLVRAEGKGVVALDGWMATE